MFGPVPVCSNMQLSISLFLSLSLSLSISLSLSLQRWNSSSSCFLLLYGFYQHFSLNINPTNLNAELFPHQRSHNPEISLQICIKQIIQLWYLKAEAFWKHRVGVVRFWPSSHIFIMHIKQRWSLLLTHLLPLLFWSYSCSGSDSKRTGGPERDWTDPTGRYLLQGRLAAHTAQETAGNQTNWPISIQETQPSWTGCKSCWLAGSDTDWFKSVWIAETLIHPSSIHTHIQALCFAFRT